ncbi:MAG: hypothetical protein NTV77_01350 [Candidatus Azambacteria bacterium]|nr:hypothetical protein [Candidatus Azambacteria bacterium]
MKYLRFIMVGLAFVFLIYVLFVIYQNRKGAETSSVQTNAPAAQEQGNKQQWETKTNDQPPVIVSVTPIEFGKGAKLWKFDVAFNTHSGSLDQDITQIATLVDGKGNTYKPIRWDGAGPGGHHREGVLSFNPVQPAPAYVELKIKDVGGVNERSFRWNLE